MILVRAQGIQKKAVDHAACATATHCLVRAASRLALSTACTATPSSKFGAGAALLAWIASVNCMANGLAGLSGLGSAEVRTKDGVRRVAIHLAAEAIKVGRARGHEVEPIWGIEAQRFVDASEGRTMADVERDMAERAKELAGGRPSLLQDVMRGRRTEVQYLNGYVAEQGRQVRVPTPFNDKVVELITRVPPGTLKPDPKNLEPLVAMLPK